MIYINDFSRKFELDLLKLCENSPYGSSIISYHEAYHGKKYDFLDFWIQRDESGNARCVFCKYYSTLIICGETHDFAELDEFVGMLDLSNIFCDSSLNLNCDMELRIGETMMCESVGNMNFEIDGGFVICRVSSDFSQLKKIYDLLLRENSNKSALSDYESYFLDISHRIRHGVSKVFAVRASCGEIVSTAAVTAVSKNSSVIGCVATDSEYRNRGFASALVGYLTAKELSKKSRVFLHREREIRIYEKIGFKTVGYWNEYSSIS